MRLFLLLTVVCLAIANFTQQAMATGIDVATAVADKYENSFLEMADVNGVGITSCNPRNGLQSFQRRSVSCIIVLFSNEDSFNDAIEKNRPPFLLEGVWVNFEYVGIISAQPGVTIHN